MGAEKSSHGDIPARSTLHFFALRFFRVFRVFRGPPAFLRFFTQSDFRVVRVFRGPSIFAASSSVFIRGEKFRAIHLVRKMGSKKFPTLHSSFSVSLCLRGKNSAPEAHRSTFSPSPRRWSFAQAPRSFCPHLSEKLHLSRAQPCQSEKWDQKNSPSTPLRPSDFRVVCVFRGQLRLRASEVKIHVQTSPFEVQRSLPAVLHPPSLVISHWSLVLRPWSLVLRLTASQSTQNHHLL